MFSKVILLVLNTYDINNFSLLMQSVNLGNDPPINNNPATFFVPLQALEILTSPPRQTKIHDNSYISDWIWLPQIYFHILNFISISLTEQCSNKSKESEKLPYVLTLSKENEVIGWKEL